VELVIFVGLQGAGKSSYYHAHFQATHAHVSKDLIPRSARNREARQRRLVDEALAAGRSVVVDNTNPTPADRAPLIAIGRARGAEVVAYHFAAPIQACLARNAGRTGRARVPEAAIFATARRLIPPSVAEGFDRVVRIDEGRAGAG
jgi:predicted kinase